ncbi:MAG: dephospho-CoA kinase [Gammaproteobacteria bacterium]|nr:dephospho-CoA kinase [Gammaproteobacteria bacterium]
MFIVGLTGGIGSGKSAAATCFSAFGITVVNADQAARIVVQPGTPVLQKIVAHFGKTILLSNGQLDRAGLRNIVFNDAQQRHWLEQLLHPLIYEQITQALAASNSAYTILESPLLIEAGQTALVDRICVVDLPPALQIKRACTRDGNTPEQINKIMQTQLSRAERRTKANDILDNSGTLQALQHQVERLHQKYLGYC